MIIEHRTRDKHQNVDSFSKKTEFYERQGQREADMPQIKDGFSFLDKETYDSLPLTRWLDNSGKPIEDHPELPKERPEKTILKRNQGMPMEIMLKSKIVRETLQAKGCDLNQVETGRTEIGDDLRRLLEKLADDKPVVEDKGKEEPDEKEVVQSLVERIPEDILKRTMARKKKVALKEKAEHLGLFTAEEDAEDEKLSGSVKNGMETQRRAAMTKIVDS